MTATGTDSGDWRRAIERFEAIGALPAGERAHALEALEVEDPALHGRVVRLFGADRAAEEAAFLASPSGPGAPPFEGPDLTGRAVGPWEVVRELGVGGMGRVWLAKRSDGRYEGLAAIKVIKAALADRGAVERFAREGRILGSLTHPSIARLVDAGTLDDGHPYLVLEYIEGERIDAWCNAKRFEPRERVRLFTAVCNAVAYAHANLVVHRDLKPSNILVTPAGEVKLLDFGIAKLLDEQRGAAEETELTQIAGRAMTPDYAAPEQVSGTPVTTATDVYSLGVVLYRLLSGRSPYQRGDGSRPSAFELQREVLEAEPRRLGGVLAGDLENIVAKALKKNPAERYASAQALRDDLQRYLDNRPVEARGDSARYVLAKFVRRHRVGVAAGAVALLAFTGGVAGVAWQSSIARQEGVRAQREAEKAKAVSDFMAGLFKANSTANPDPAKARATTARELLDLGRARAAKDLAGNPEAHQEVLLLLGKLYYELGLTTEAAPLDRERIALLRQLDGNAGPRLARALANLGGTLIAGSARAEAVVVLKEALALLDAAGDRASVTRGELLSNYATAQRFLDPSKSIELQREAAAFFEAHFPGSDRYVRSLRSLARDLNEHGRTEEAAEAIEKALALGPKAEGMEAHFMAYLYQTSAVIQAAQQHSERALQEISRAIEIDERTFGAGSRLRPMLEADRALVSQAGPDWKAAVARLQAIAAGLELGEPGLQRSAAFVQAALAHIHLRSGDVSAGRKALAAALPAYRSAASKPLLASLLAAGAELELLGGRETAARAHIDELRALRNGALVGNAAIAEFADEVEGRLLLAQRDPERARALLAARLDAIANSGSPAAGDRLRRAGLELAMAEAEERVDAVREAEKRARDLLDAVEGRPDREWFALLEAQAALRLASVLRAQGRDAEARPYRERAARLLAERQVPTSPRLALKK